MKKAKPSPAPLARVSRAEMQFCELWLRVRYVGAMTFASLPADEQHEINSSMYESARRLALKNVGYNRSAGQKGQEGFDRGQFAFRAWKYLPAIHDEIDAAVKANNLDYFIALGKAVEKLKDQPADQALNGDPLGGFLTKHWIKNNEPAFVPSLCFLTSQVLTEVCQRCLDSGKLTARQLELTVDRLGLQRTKSVKIGNAGLDEKHGILMIAEDAKPLRKHGVKLIC